MALPLTHTGTTSTSSWAASARTRSTPLRSLRALARFLTMHLATDSQSVWCRNTPPRTRAAHSASPAMSSSVFTTPCISFHVECSCLSSPAKTPSHMSRSWRPSRSNDCTEQPYPAPLASAHECTSRCRPARRMRVPAHAGLRSSVSHQRSADRQALFSLTHSS